MQNSQISPQKQALIDAKNASKLQVGETIGVKEGKCTNMYTNNPERISSFVIQSIKGDKLTIKHADSSVQKSEYIIYKQDIESRNIRDLGANPFVKNTSRIRPVQFDLQSIVFNLNILGNKERISTYHLNGIEVQELNWNPIVFDKEGNKQYYQRPFVWTKEDNQLLISSIYQGIECGRILVRKRSFNELRVLEKAGIKELAFNDIVDGKQRLNAIRGFMKNEYPDTEGNYYADLSLHAQYQFTNHQLFSYMQMEENTKDEDVIYQFLRLNFAGVPQSKEHIEYIKSLQQKM